MMNEDKVIVVSGAVLVVGLVSLVAYLTHEREFDANVADSSWSKTITREERYVANGEGWRDGFPDGSFNVANCGQRQRGTHSCNPHTVGSMCMGYSNGKTTWHPCFKTVYDQCPTMAEWCSYSVHKWRVIDSRRTDGSTCHLADANVLPWPKTPDEWSPPVQDPEHRLVRTEEYDVLLRGDDAEYRLHPGTEEEFRRYCDNPTWLMAKTPLGDARTVKPR